MKRNLVFRSAVAVAALSSCNTYQFEPITPCAFSSSSKTISVAAQPGKPDLFLLVDKSGSMKFTTSADPMCSSCISSACAIAGCPTRWDDLTAAMHAFLPATAAQVHLGMLPFPVATEQQTALQCTAAALSDLATLGVPLDSSADTDVAGMTASATAVQARIDGIDPFGGTPTGAAVNALLGYSALTQPGDHPAFMLLLTDGVPNCDAALDANSCSCTEAATPCSVNVGGAALNLCLDDTGTAAQIAALEGAGVRTIVVGFGNETLGGSGPATLQQLGAAGGFHRPCAADADCGAGDSCSVNAVDACGKPSKACARSYYQATDAASLATTLAAIRDTIMCVNPCFQTLNDPPSDPSLLAVEFNGSPMPANQPDTWSYDPTTHGVTFQGAACQQLKASNDGNPVKLEFRSADAVGGSCE